MNLRHSFFDLYHSISTMEFRMNSKTQGDVSYRDIMYLNMIMFMDECTVSKLADLMGITKPAVTVKINHLIEQGLVLKQKSKTDERVNMLMVAPKVYTMYSDEDRQINRALAKLCEDYPPDEVNKFSEMLESLAKNLIDMDI